MIDFWLDIIDPIVEFITGKRDCMFCGKGFQYRLRETMLEEEIMTGHEPDLDKLSFCTSSCAVKNRDAEALLDQAEYESKEYGHITEETRQKIDRLRRR